jgi:DNA-binding response OmpR family regulator
MRCLVADGSATTRALVSNALRRAGARDIVALGSLDEALAACETRYDLAVVDRDLGPGPGWDWLGGLRDRACEDGRLLVIGTRVSRDEAQALRALGAGAFLLKPLDPELLRERAQALLGEAESGEEGDGAEPVRKAA